jgi:RNA polymerase sigma factor (sigma-70 family)
VRPKGATPAELEALYRDRFESFARVASAICGDRDRGRDAVQTAFAAAVQSRRSFKATGSLEGWVWRIVVNEARRIAGEPSQAPVHLTSESATNGQGEGPLGVAAWIATLPPRQRDAVFLRYYADLEYRAIADVLGVKVGTVSATLASAHEALRKRLGEATR